MEFPAKIMTAIVAGRNVKKIDVNMPATLVIVSNEKSIIVDHFSLSFL